MRHRDLSLDRGCKLSEPTWKWWFLAADLMCESKKHGSTPRMMAAYELADED